MKSKYFLLPALVLATASFSACSDEEYDFPGDSRTLVYAADFSGSYKVVQTPAGAMGSMSVPVTAKSNSRAVSDIKVTVAVDNDLIDAYNEEHGTSYLPLPAEALVLDKTEITIPAGEMVSAEAVTVSLTEDQEVLKNLNDDNGYIIPVRLASVSGGGAALATSIKSISYLTIGITNDAVNHDGILADSKGTPVDDWTGWSISANDFRDSWSSSGIESVFDGDAKNYWAIQGNSDELIVTVDMGKSYKFDAIQAKYADGWGSYITDYGSFPGGTKIAISSDGSNWSNVGEVKVGNSRAALYVLLWGYLEARYIKLTINSTSSWSRPSFQCGYFTVNAL